MTAIPQLEAKDFAVIDAALQIVEATILCRAHLPRTERQLTGLQEAIQHERRVLNEKAAKSEYREATKRAEDAAAERLLGWKGGGGAPSK
jgi:hypothetical protein